MLYFGYPNPDCGCGCGSGIICSGCSIPLSNLQITFDYDGSTHTLVYLGLVGGTPTWDTGTFSIPSPTDPTTDHTINGYRFRFASCGLSGLSAAPRGGAVANTPDGTGGYNPPLSPTCSPLSFTFTKAGGALHDPTHTSHATVHL